MYKICRRNRNTEQTYAYIVCHQQVTNNTAKRSNSMHRNLLIPVNMHATQKTSLLQADFVFRLIIQRHLDLKLHSNSYICCQYATSEHATQP